MHACAKPLRNLYSITSWMVRATLRDALGAADGVACACMRFQDAAPFLVETSTSSPAPR